MDPNVVAPTTPPDQPPIQNTGQQQAPLRTNSLLKNKKMLIIIAVILVVLVIGGIFLLIFNNKSTQVSDFTPKQVQKFIEEDKSDDFKYIGTSIIEWLDTVKEPNGRYLFAETCTEPNSCDSSVVDNRVGLYALWGKYKFYKYTKDSSVLSSVNADIETYSDVKKVPVLQNIHWNCKLMYELGKSGDFDKEREELLKSICVRGTYINLDNYDNLDQASDTFLAPFVDQIINGETVSMTFPAGASPDQDFIQFSTSSSDYIYQFLFNGKLPSYQAGQLHFKRALELYSSNKDVVQDEAALLGIAALDIYKINKNQRYLDLAKFIYTKHYGSAECEKLNSCLYSIMLADELYEITNDQSYYFYSKNNLRRVSQRYFDGDKFVVFKYGKETFHTDTVSSQVIYPVMQNGLILGLFKTYTL